jgi:hypothetical protein
MARRNVNRLGRPFLRLFIVVLIAFSCGCQRQQPTLVPVSELKPLMTYQNSSPRFRLKVFMYAPGNLLFRVENLLAEFHLVQLPDLASATGRILQARLIGEESIEFNLILPDASYAESPNDVTIPWVLEEKGADAFLRSEGTILVNIGTSARAKYFVKSVTYEAGSDLPQPKGEIL